MIYEKKIKDKWIGIRININRKNKIILLYIHEIVSYIEIWNPKISRHVLSECYAVHLSMAVR